MQANQGEYQKFQTVKQVIIEPMTTLYTPPAHLREDKKAREAVLLQYARDLSGFSKQALERGWEDTKAEHKTWNWPHFQSIKDNCRKHYKVYDSNNLDVSGELPWVQKDKKAQSMCREYMNSFMQGALALEAIQGEWSKDLRSYAHDTATVQAALIVGVKNYGYTNAVYQWGGSPQELNSKRRDAFEAECLGQSAKGTISVTVPSDAIEAWKSSVMQRKQIQEGKAA